MVHVETYKNDEVPPERDLVDTEKPKQLLFEQQKPFTLTKVVGSFLRSRDKQGAIGNEKEGF